MIVRGNFEFWVCFILSPALYIGVNLIFLARMSPKFPL